MFHILASAGDEPCLWGVVLWVRTLCVQADEQGKNRDEQGREQILEKWARLLHELAEEGAVHAWRAALARAQPLLQRGCAAPRRGVPSALSRLAQLCQRPARQIRLSRLHHHRTQGQEI